MSNARREGKYQQYVRGWVNYFKPADMKWLLKETDEWARRRIRAVYWKQWKKIKTKYRMLKALGMEHWKAKELACSRKGYWRMAKVLNQIVSIGIILQIFQRDIPQCMRHFMIKLDDTIGIPTPYLL